MARPHVFAADTVLYHPVEGKRVFPKGETDPGPAWSDKPGGEPVGSKTSLQALHDLIEAQERIEQLEAALERNGADLDKMAKERSDALAKVSGLEQEVHAAQKAKSEAEDLAVQYMRERDEARKQLSTAGASPKAAAAKA